MHFKDRLDAGCQLAQKLLGYFKRPDVIVLGLARGGVIVAAEVARRLHVPLNVIVVRKIGAPGNPELAIGAIGESGEGVFNRELIAYLGVSPDALQHEVAIQKKNLQARLALYRGITKAPNLSGKVVILVDDGIATGASAHAAIQSVRSQSAKEIVLAVPVAAPQALSQLMPEVETVVCLYSPDAFEAVGEFYELFGQTTDEEIVALLRSDYSQA